MRDADASRGINVRVCIAVFMCAASVFLAGCAESGLGTQPAESTWRPTFAKRPSVDNVPVAGAQQTPGPADDVLVAHLDDGLTVIVKPVRTAPVVCVRAYVCAGGLFEKEWLGCGLSHLCEHLVAKESIHDMPGGGPAQSVQKKGSLSQEIGGQANAYTTMDHTCYYIAADAGKTMQCIDLIAGQLAHPEITQADFDREHGVVQRELEMGKDDPSRRIWYAHLANCFGAHPASVPTIGFAGPLKSLTRGDVLKYVRRMYVPQNMVFVVVGDVDGRAVVERVKERFKGLPKSRQPDLSLPPVPPLTGIRLRILTNGSIRDVMERISFQTIPLIHDDLYALDVLSYVLSRGRSSRLVRKLQYEKSLVTSVSTSSWTPSWGRGFFTVSFRADAGKADRARRAILAELRKVVADGVAPAELARAKRQKLADLVQGRQTVESLAAQLATDYLSTGDVSFSRNYTGRIQRVTPGEVRSVARKYFRFDNMAITRMIPQSLASVAAAGKIKKAVRPKTMAFKLPNGLRVVLQPVKGAGLVAMTFVTTGGLLLEDEKTNGIGSMMMALSARGAGKRTGEQIAAFFDAAGGGITGRCGNNTFYWQASVLKDRFDGALEIFSDVVQVPTMPADELARLRPLAVAAIRQIDEQWTPQLQKFFRRKFFGVVSPYHMLSAGSTNVVEHLTVERLGDYHARVIRANRSVLAITGDFDAGDAKKRIEKLFARLADGEVAMPAVAARKIDPKGELYILPTKNVQAGVIVAVPGMKITNIPDRLAITVLDTIISGYHLPSGWLHTELRGKRLVYVVHAYNWAGLLPGAFITYAGCQPEKAPQVVKIIRKNLEKAARYTPTRKEVDRAVNVILTADALDLQTMSSLAMTSALDELYGLGYDFRIKSRKLYRRVTPADVARVGRKYLSGGYVVAVTTPRPELFKTSSTMSKGKSK